MEFYIKEEDIRKDVFEGKPFILRIQKKVVKWKDTKESIQGTFERYRPIKISQTAVNRKLDTQTG